MSSSSDMPDFANRDRSNITILYVPVEGEIKVLPWTPSTDLHEILECKYYEGFAFADMNLIEKGYRLAGFVRGQGRIKDPVNKRCSKIYITDMPGPIVIMNEDSKGRVPLTKEDIPFIFYNEPDLQ